MEKKEIFAKQGTMEKSLKPTAEATPIKRGGFRAGSGRLKVDDKKKPITIYIEESKIQQHGGSALLKKKITKSIK